MTSENGMPATRVHDIVRRSFADNEPTLLESIRAMPTGSELELLARPCHDCAVTTGFYREYSDAYKDMPHEEQLARSKQWFCHNVCNRACRGHANNIGVSW